MTTAVEDAQLAFQHGDYERAIRSADALIAASADSYAARLVRINAAIQLKRWHLAIADLEHLLRSRKDNPKLRHTLSECWLRAGNELKQTDRRRAVEAYRNALTIDAGNGSARFNLALVLTHSGSLQEARAELETLRSLHPDDASATVELAGIHVTLGEVEKAQEILQHIAETANDQTLRKRSAILLVEIGSYDVALRAAQRLLDEGADLSAWALSFARTQRSYGELTNSRLWLDMSSRRAIAPSNEIAIALSRMLGLPSAYRDVEEIRHVRDEFAANLDELVALYPLERIVQLSLKPDDLLWENFLLAYQGGDDAYLQHVFGRWWSAALSAVTPTRALSQRHAQSSRRPRIALVSSLFHECTVGSYFASWVEYLAAKEWNLFLVHVGAKRDALTERLARSAGHELTLDRDVSNNANDLRELDADIILYPEIGMDFRTSALAALRLSPVQVCGWGHPVTTGLPTIDAFLSCEDMEPPAAQRHYTEPLIKLPGLGTRYFSPRLPDALKRSELGLPDAGNLFLVPHSLFKLHPDNDVIYSEVLRLDPSSTLIFFDGVVPGARKLFRQRLSRRLEEQGMSLEHRTRFLAMRSRDAFLQIVMACDVVLDSLHWSGGNVSLDALHCGVPVVTCPGRFMRGRQTMAMLRHLDCGDLICDSIPDLVAAALGMANNQTRRSNFQRKLNANFTRLTQSDAPLSALDTALRKLLKHS